MRINAAGLALVKEFESLKLTAYADPVGVWTIGYGHTGPDVRPGMTITEQQADIFLADDMANAEAAVTRAIAGRRLPSGNQFSAMVSLTFNIGPGSKEKEGFGQSSVLKAFLAGDDVAAAKAFSLWNKGTNSEKKKIELKGLTRRRAAEAALYLTPTEADQAVKPQLTAASDAAPAAAPLGKTKAALAVTGTVGEMAQQLQSTLPFLSHIPSWAFGTMATIGLAGFVGVIMIERAKAK